MPQTPRVVIAGLRGGSGKTTLSLGLVRALAGRGLAVAPFKKGPDYIDAGWLATASGTACRNLDPYMMSSAAILRSFAGHSAHADVAVIEGNRGLFDGHDARGTFSTSSLARMLKAPVVLIVDATKSTRTLAALVLGAARLERSLRLAGVVLNNVGGKRHARIATEAIEHYTGVPVLGAIPRAGESLMPERHMGLTPWQEHPGMRRAIERAAKHVAAHVDIDRVIQIARSAPALKPPALDRKVKVATGGLRIGVMRDSAFQFYYPENIEALQARGAEVVIASALRNRRLPAIDALYIGGGFPETNALRLAGNESFRKSLLRAIEDGLPVYAECGGLMYLGRAIELAGESHPMAGALPVSFRMHARPHAHGYTEVEATSDNPFFAEGTVLRGHEFHYSEPLRAAALLRSRKVGFGFRMIRGAGIAGGMDGICYKGVLGTYTHLHALGSPEWAEAMMRAAKAYQEGR